MIAAGSRSPGRGTLALVGRDRELAELMAGLEDALAGQGRLFLIAGEPGIGKTGLAEQLGREATERGAQVVWGRCWEGGGAPPFWPWVQVVREVAEGLDDASLGRLLGSGARYVAQLAPDLADRLALAPSSASSSSEADTARFYLFEAVTRFLKRAAAEQPLLLILDDLHAADDPSLLLLRYLARDLRSASILVVGTYRDLEVSRDPGLAEALGELARDGQLTTLRGLSDGDVRALIGNLTGAAPSDGISLAVHETTEGNPLFVREAVRLLASSGGLDQPGRPGVPIPGSVRALIQQRLAPLSADAVQSLSVAAIVGRDFDLSLVAPACELPQNRVLGAISEAVALGVVVEEPAIPGRYRFSHSLMREVTYESLPIPVRTSLHRMVGEAIERLYGASSDGHLTELSRHFAEAASAAESGKAQTYARRAGDRAMQAHAYEEAAAEYQRALHALDLGGPGGADDALRCELLLLLGAAQVRAGRYPEAKAIHLQAVEIARHLGATDLLARASLGFGEPHVEGGHVDRQLIALLREALDALPGEDSALRTRLLARLAVELTFSEEVNLIGRLSQEAVEMARRVGDARALGAALDARWMAVWGPDGQSERAALGQESLLLAQATGDRDLELHSRAQNVTGALESGDVLTVEAEIAAYARQSDELQMPVHRWVLTSMRAMRALLLGQLAEAEPLIAEAFAAQPERPNARWAHQLELTQLRWEQGCLVELHQRWLTQVERFPRLAMARAWLALADLERGDVDAARRASQVLGERLPGLARTGLWLPGAVLAAQVAARVDDAEAARALYPVLLPYAEQVASMNMEQPVVCFGVGAYYLGLLATAMASWNDAERHFESAIRIHERMGAPPLLARARVEYARMLVRRGQGDDHRRAAELLSRAEVTAESLGLAELARQIAALRETHAEQPAAVEQRTAATPQPAVASPATATATPVSTTPPTSRDRFQREGELWTVSFDSKLVHLKDSKGLRQLAHLLAQPGRELHATDLEARVNGPAEPSTPGRSRNADHGELGLRADGGDAGEMLDAEARAAYKARLDELQEEIDEAEDFNDPERAERARGERELLIRELARAVGIGGRDRKAASHAERARLNATRAIRSAMTSVAKVHPSLGEHLVATIRTGRYCSYTPDPRSPVAWEL